MLVLFPDSNLRTSKRRVIVAMISSNLARAGHPSRLLVQASPGSGLGLLTDSVIMTDNLATIHESEIDQVIGHFPHIAQLDLALRTTLAL